LFLFLLLSFVLSSSADDESTKCSQEIYLPSKSSDETITSAAFGFMSYEESEYMVVIAAPPMVYAYVNLNATKPVLFATTSLKNITVCNKQISIYYFWGGTDSFFAICYSLDYDQDTEIISLSFPQGKIYSSSYDAFVPWGWNSTTPVQSLASMEQDSWLVLPLYTPNDKAIQVIDFDEGVGEQMGGEELTSKECPFVQSLTPLMATKYCTDAPGVIWPGTIFKNTFQGPRLCARVNGIPALYNAIQGESYNDIGGLLTPTGDLLNVTAFNFSSCNSMGEGISIKTDYSSGTYPFPTLPLAYEGTSCVYTPLGDSTIAQIRLYGPPKLISTVTTASKLPQNLIIASAVRPYPNMNGMVIYTLGPNSFQICSFTPCKNPDDSDE